MYNVGLRSDTPHNGNLCASSPHLGSHGNVKRDQPGFFGVRGHPSGPWGCWDSDLGGCLGLLPQSHHALLLLEPCDLLLLLPEELPLLCNGLLLAGMAMLEPAPTHRCCMRPGGSTHTVVPIAHLAPLPCSPQLAYWIEYNFIMKWCTFLTLCGSRNLITDIYFKYLGWNGTKKNSGSVQNKWLEHGFGSNHCLIELEDRQVALN